MSNEIKVGDKVRVRKDAPRIYTDGWRFDWRNLESIVSIIENEDAVISPDDSGEEELTIPTKYLIKVDAEAEKPKFKVGDKVVRKNVSTVRTIISIDYVDDDEAPAYHYNTVDSQGNNPMDFLESELILYTESTPKYKKGDRVKICSKNAERFGRVGTILEVHDNGTVVVDFNDYYVGGHLYSVDFIEPYTEPTAPTIKVGDRVKFKNIYELQKVKDESFRWMLVMFASKEATITAVEDNGFYRVDIDPSIGGINDDMIECKVEPTEQTEAEKTDSDVPFSIFRDDLLSNPQIVNLHNGMHYWQCYEANLAKEVALKVANKYNDPKEAAEYAVSVAKAVAEGLKRK